jgi:5-methylthioadenosine/S-adenosylhomocysteine deaminase
MMKTRNRILVVIVITLSLLLGTYLQPVLASPTLSKDSLPIVLRGTIVTPDGVIKHGYILIENGRIMDVSDKQPEVKNAIKIDTRGIIYPGLVDVHNHVPWNVLPRWNPPMLYTNRYQWRADPDFLQEVSIPFNNLINSYLCDMNSYGEMRALVGGTTSILATRANLCIHGLVRNLDYNSGFYGTTELNLEHIINVLDLPPASDPVARQTFTQLARIVIANPAYEALFIHLSEGTDAVSLEEFTYIQSQGLLNPKGVIIHGIPLGPSQFEAMASNGTSLVWSPRSNIVLYGQTADVQAALDAGVQVALAPDWAITGSSNMLDELHFADQWNQEYLGGHLSDEQLVNMVTRIPAQIAGIDDETGAIQPGLRADLLVISGNHDHAYRALIAANPEDIQLVLIDGVPVYGDTKEMSAFWNESDLEQIQVGDVYKALAAPAAKFSFAHVVNRLRTALEVQGISLAPLPER